MNEEIGASGSRIHSNKDFRSALSHNNNMRMEINKKSKKSGFQRCFLRGMWSGVGG